MKSGKNRKKKKSAYRGLLEWWSLCPGEHVLWCDFFVASVVGRGGEGGAKLWRQPFVLNCVCFIRDVGIEGGQSCDVL